MALTTAGVNYIAQAITGLGTPFNQTNAYLGVGDGTAAFAASQTNLLGTNKVRKVVDGGYPIVTPPTVTFRSTFAPGEANFAWEEWGIFNDGTGGVMLSRVLESNGTKQSNQTWILEVAITFTLGN